MKNILRIAIDGGAATGKSSVSKTVAKKLGITYINTGQMYRLIALFAFKNNLENDEDKLYELIKNMEVSFDEYGLINSDLISFDQNEIESNKISLVASKIASYEKIRKVSTSIQKKIGSKKGILLEGRDIGTVIMPDADYKFFLEVDPVVAAKRRIKQHEENGDSVSYKEILNGILKRNEQDKNRKVGPLIKSPDSITIDTSNNSIEEISNKIIEVING